MSSSRIAHLEAEVQRLQQELDDARRESADRYTVAQHVSLSTSLSMTKGMITDVTAFDQTQLPSHALLYLADTALPLGSFAFSSGLESYLAHHNPQHNAKPDVLYRFLTLSLQSIASTTLPYLMAVYRSPEAFPGLDDSLDACLMCPVTRRASISQGRALITVWERALRTQSNAGSASTALHNACGSLRTTSSINNAVELNAHFPLIYALVCNAHGLTLHETAYTYLLNHAKAVASAAVRANVLGPYAAQALLGSDWLRENISSLIGNEWWKDIEGAGQSVPAMDVWSGRHELLYSRIFNS